MMTDREFRRVEADRVRAYRETMRREQPEKYLAVKARDRERMRRRRAQEKAA